MQSCLQFSSAELLHSTQQNASTSLWCDETWDMLPSYSQPLKMFPVPLWLKLVYYGVFMPFAFAGNFLTCVLIGKRLQWRNNVPDVLVGGLALNDFLTCVVVFLPSIVAECLGQWPNHFRFCQFHAVTTVWYLYTTFAIIVVMSVDRWLALKKPFYYQTKVTTLHMKLVIGGLGLFCLLLGSVPLLFYPVVLRNGWYCTVAEFHCVNNTSGATMPSLYMLITFSYIITGLLILVVFTGLIIVIMSRNRGPGCHGDNKQHTFAKMMGVVAIIFLVTWTPSLVSMKFCMWLDDAAVCSSALFWSSRWVNIGVALNPIVYGLMKRTYRAEYKYLLYKLVYYLLCRTIRPPVEEKLVFGPARSGRGNGERAILQPKKESSRAEGASSQPEDIQDKLANREDTPRIPKKDIINNKRENT